MLQPAGLTEVWFGPDDKFTVFMAFYRIAAELPNRVRPFLNPSAHKLFRPCCVAFGDASENAFDIRQAAFLFQVLPNCTV